MFSHILLLALLALAASPLQAQLLEEYFNADPGKPRMPGTEQNPTQMAILVQFILTSILGFFSVLLFCYVRTRLKCIYSPKALKFKYFSLQLLIDGRTPLAAPSFFGWIIQIYNYSDAEILSLVGFDAYIVFLFS